MDSLTSLYKFSFRSMRWYLYIFHHLLHVSVVNAWLFYRREAKLLDQKAIPLKTFQMDVADCLIKIKNPVGRPSLLKELIPPRKMKRSFAVSSLIRNDDCGHYPVYSTKRSRCRLCPSSSIFTHFQCCKCESFLCLTKDRNCFYDFHHQ
jgi:hypothetical protein